MAPGRADIIRKFLLEIFLPQISNTDVHWGVVELGQEKYDTLSHFDRFVPIRPARQIWGKCTFDLSWNIAWLSMFFC